MAKTTKRKYFQGYKKLKHVKLFEQFAINENEFKMGDKFELDWDGKAHVEVVAVEGDQVTISRGEGEGNQMTLSKAELQDWIDGKEVSDEDFPEEQGEVELNAAAKAKIQQLAHSAETQDTDISILAASIANKAEYGNISMKQAKDALFRAIIGA